MQALQGCATICWTMALQGPPVVSTARVSAIKAARQAGHIGGVSALPGLLQALWSSAI